MDLSALQVVGVRYSGQRYNPEGQRVLDECISADVYAAAQVPFDIAEPRIEESEGEEGAVLGVLGGAIADEVAAARRAEKAVLMTGGNCHHITGVLGGLQDAHGIDARVGLVWLDAHGDFNTPYTTLSGSLGGMPWHGR